MRRQSLAVHARRTRQGKTVSHRIEIIGHAQFGIIDRIVNAIGCTALQGCTAGPGQIVSMDVVGVDVLIGHQGRHRTLQALDRQPFSRVNAGHAQNTDGDTKATSPGTQGSFRIAAAHGPGIRGGQGARLIDPGSGTIAVNPCCAYVNQATW